MPSVASEVQNSASVRSHLHGTRSTARGQQPPSPFSEMLDSAAPADTPAQPQLRRDRSETTDMPAPSKPADGNDKVARGQPGENTSTNDAADVQTDGDGLPASIATAAEASPAPSTAAPAIAAADADVPKSDAKTDAKPKAASDDATAVEPAIANVAPPPATPPMQAPQPNPVQAAVTPADDDAAETTSLPALQAAAAAQAAGKPAKSQGTDNAASPTQDASDTPAPTQASDGKPASARDADGGFVANQTAIARTGLRVTPTAKPTQGNGQATANSDSTRQGIAPADDAGATPQAADGKQPPAKGDAEPAEARRSFAELFSRSEANTPQAPSASSGAAMPATAGVDASAAASAAAAATNASSTSPVAPTAAAAMAPQAAAIPISGLAVEIATQASNGNRDFAIRLDPPELGRIEVKLKVDRDGSVSTHMIADRSDTLDLLKRDSASLERALQDSGLKTSDNGLQFSLRQQDSSNDQTSSQNTAQVIVTEDDATPVEAVRQGYGRLHGLGGGLDIRV